jgi:hypothetical protein
MNARHAALASIVILTIALSFSGSNFQHKRLRIQSPKQGLEALLRPSIIRRSGGKPNETRRRKPCFDVGSFSSK